MKENFFGRSPVRPIANAVLEIESIAFAVAGKATTITILIKRGPEF